MDEHGAVEIICSGDHALERFLIMSVDRPEVLDAEILEQHALRKHTALEGPLHGLARGQDGPTHRILGLGELT